MKRQSRRSNVFIRIRFVILVEKMAPLLDVNVEGQGSSLSVDQELIDEREDFIASISRSIDVSIDIRTGANKCKLKSFISLITDSRLLQSKLEVFVLDSFDPASFSIFPCLTSLHGRLCMDTFVKPCVIGDMEFINSFCFNSVSPLFSFFLFIIVFRII